MKILHVIPSISPTKGGPTQEVLGMVSSLRSAGVEAEIVTTDDDGSERLNVPLNQRVNYSDVPVWFLPRFNPPLKEFLFSADLTDWLYQHAGEYHLFHNHYLFCYAPTCAAAIARQRKIPYIISTNGQLAATALAQNRLKKQIYSLLFERRNLSKAAAIHCTSAVEIHDLHNFGIETPGFVLPIGINEQPLLTSAKEKLHEIYQIPAQTPVILFLGRLNSYKRPDLLIQSLSQVATAKLPFHLILAGSGETGYIHKLKHLIDSENLASQISFVGFVSGDEKNLLLQGSDLCVTPSFSENFGIAIVEAMGAGLPVIVTSGVQLAREISEAQAGLVVAGNPIPLAQAITQLLTSPKLRYDLGINGKKLVKSKYSWTIISEKLISIYSTIIEGG